MPTNEELGLQIASLEWDMGATAEELQKLNTFWLEKYTELHETVTKIAHGMSVAIGVRNTKIAELNGKITTLANHKAMVEMQLIRPAGKGMWIPNLLQRVINLEERNTTLEKQLKKLTEQVDLNSQTLEALQ